MEEIFREVCQVPCEDGLELDAGSVRGEEIRGPDEYDADRYKTLMKLFAAVRAKGVPGYEIDPPPQVQG